LTGTPHKPIGAPACLDGGPVSLPGVGASLSQISEWKFRLKAFTSSTEEE
jgi:hypothetical protein